MIFQSIKNITHFYLSLICIINMYIIFHIVFISVIMYATQRDILVQPILGSSKNQVSENKCLEIRLQVNW